MTIITQKPSVMVVCLLLTRPTLSFFAVFVVVVFKHLFGLPDSFFFKLYDRLARAIKLGKEAST